MGILDPFSDPSTLGILALAQGRQPNMGGGIDPMLAFAGNYLANSGPSFQPHSVSSALGHGLQGAQQAMVQAQQLRQAEAYRQAQILHMMEQNKRLQEQTALAREQMLQNQPYQQSQIIRNLSSAASEQRKAQTEGRQQTAQDELSRLISGGGYQANTPGAEPPNAVFQTDAEAIRAVQEATARGQPFNADVPSPSKVRGLAIQADPTGRLLGRLQPDTGAAAGRLAPREVQDDKSPTGWSWQNPTTGALTPGAPVPSTVIGQQNVNLRGRSIDYTTGGGGQPLPGAPTIGGQPSLPTESVTERPPTPQVVDKIRTQTTAQVVKGLEENYTRLRDVPQQLSSIEKAKALVPDARVFQGPLGEQKMWVAKFFNANTPIKIDVSGIQSAEELRTRIFMNVMDNLKKMDAQPSQLQQQIMQDALGKLGTDPDALPNVLDAYAGALKDKVGLYHNQVNEAKAIGVNWPHRINIGKSDGQSDSVMRKQSKSGRPIHSNDGGKTWEYD